MKKGARLLVVIGLAMTLPRMAVARSKADGVLQAAEAGVAASAAPAEATAGRRKPPLGFQADAGLPDGLMVALVVRPVRYLRLHAGGGSNTSTGGIRGGIALVPLGSGPSLNLDLGHYFAGKANGLVRASVQGLGRFSSYVNEVAYTFANAHAGLEFGEGMFTFYVRGGLSFVRATLKDVTAPADVGTGRTTVAFNQDPIVRLVSPSAKLGVILYLP